MSYGSSWSTKSRRRGASSLQGLGLLFFIFLSVVLLALSRMNNSAVGTLRGWLIEVVSPVVQAVDVPASYVRRSLQRMSRYTETFQEMDRLRRENQRLRQWEWRARQLERKVAQLRRLLHAVEALPMRFATGRVIAQGQGPFQRSVLINIGKGQGVRNGLAVVNAEGLVGRTIETGQGVARVLLLTDTRSRIPVKVGQNNVRAVLIGDNAAQPRLDFLPPGARIFDGDIVFTSGEGNLLPQGLRVGVVKRTGRVYRVQTGAQLETLEFVSVLIFTPDKKTMAQKATDDRGKPDTAKSTSRP